METGVIFHPNMITYDLSNSKKAPQKVMFAHTKKAGSRNKIRTDTLSAKMMINENMESNLT